MALPSTQDQSWFSGFDFPGQLLNQWNSEYELYEEDDEFILSIELPGYEREDISVSWDDGILNVGAEHHNESAGRRRTYHRRFRFPLSVESDGIEAQYRNGVLEIRLPVTSEAVLSGEQIEVTG